VSELDALVFAPPRTPEDYEDLAIRIVNEIRHGRGWVVSWPRRNGKHLLWNRVIELHGQDETT